jgi:hypothetical protein
MKKNCQNLYNVALAVGEAWETEVKLTNKFNWNPTTGQPQSVIKEKQR